MLDIEGLVACRSGGMILRLSRPFERILLSFECHLLPNHVLSHGRPVALTARMKERHLAAFDIRYDYVL